MKRRQITHSAWFTSLIAALRMRITVPFLAVASTMGAGFDLDPLIVGNSEPYPPRGPVRSVAVRNGIAFCAVGLNLGIFDVLDPAKPLWLAAGTADGLGIGGRVALFGNYACLVQGAHLSTFDVAEPAKPRLLATVGPFPYSGWTYDITVAGHYVYVALGDQGIQVIDLVDPAHPQKLGQILTHRASGVAVAGDHAYVADDVAGLEVINVSNPAKLLRVGGYKTGGHATAVAVQDNHAFVATGDEGLQVIDISSPAAPRGLGVLKTSGYTVSVAVSGNYAYVGDSSGRVHIIDTSDPSNMLLVGSYQTGGFELWQIALNGSRAFVAAGLQGLQVIDLHDPTNPRRVGMIAADGTPWSMAMRGNHAIVAEGNSGLQIIDVSNPNRPRRVGEHKTEGAARSLVLQGNLAYTLATLEPESVRLEIFDVTNMSNPIRLGALNTGRLWPVSFAVAGGYVYLIGGSDASGWLDIIDVRNSASPAALTSVVMDPSGRSLAIGNAHLYIGSDQAVQIFDLQDPASPKRQGRVDLTDAGPIALADNYLYVNASSLLVVDVRDPNQPRVVSESDTGNVGRGQIVVAGKFAFLLSGQTVSAVDVSDPLAPRLVASIQTRATAFAAAAVDERLLILEGSSGHIFAPFWTSGIELIDFGRWANPQRIEYQTGPKDSMALSGNLACVTATLFHASNPSTLLEILDVSDPKKTILVGTTIIAGNISDVAIVGSRAYLAVNNITTPGTTLFAYELQIIGLSNPNVPTKLGSIRATGSVNEIALSGNHAYLAGNGLEIIDVSNPADPKRLGRHSTSAAGYNVAIAGNLAYLSTAHALEILDITIAGNPLLLSSVPALAAYSRVAPFGNYICVAKEYFDDTGAGAFLIMDVSNPTKPREVSRVLTRSDTRVRDVVVTQNHAYVAMLDSNSPHLGRVEVYDLADPANPRRVGGNTAVHPYRLALSADRLFVVGPRGLTSLNLYVPVRLDSPVSRQGTFRFSLGGPSNWRLRVQRSSDAVNWNDWQTVTLGPTVLELDDLEVSGQSNRFYRAVAP